MLTEVRGVEEREGETVEEVLPPTRGEGVGKEEAVGHPVEEEEATEVAVGAFLEGLGELEEDGQREGVDEEVPPSAAPCAAVEEMEAVLE
jgi:hypothetical protein